VSTAIALLVLTAGDPTSLVLTHRFGQTTAFPSSSDVFQLAT
jgi:hypothetical protein